MNSIARESLLYDLYGSLLTDKKRSVMECYHEDDMSLGEIADDMGISRAAVYDSLKSAEAQLELYEEKLGLLAKYEKASILADEADSIISSLESKTSTADKTAHNAESSMDKNDAESAREARSQSGAGAEQTMRLREIIAQLASND